MSFILDALKKSETERQRESAPSLSRLPLATVQHRTPVWIWLLLASLSLAVVGLVFAWWTSENLGSASPAGGPVAAAVAPPPVAIETESVPSAATLTETLGAAAANQRLRPIAELRTVDPNQPDYRLEVVAYNARDPSGSSAWINGRRYYVGERVGSGPELVEVRSDSVVLAFAGSRFLLTTR